jgi:hypothetical protein
MAQASVNRAVRTTRHTRALGPEARCSRCGCADPATLIPPAPPKRRRTRSATLHSLAGSDGPDGPDASAGAGDADPPAPPTTRRRTARPRAEVLCYECSQARDGKPTVEAHHPLGQVVDPETTIPLPGNAHRAMSDLQRDRPRELATNPERDPLVWLAQMCHALKEHLTHWVERLDAIADFLLDLARKLRGLFGSRWWEYLGLVPFWAVAPEVMA